MPLHSIRLDNVIEANGHSTGWRRDGTPLRTSTPTPAYSRATLRLGLNPQQSELIRRLTKAAHETPIGAGGGGGGKQQARAWQNLGVRRARGRSPRGRGMEPLCVFE